MDPSVSQDGNVKRIFVAARRITEASARQAFLDEVCRDAPEVRDRVEGLLAALEIPNKNPLDQVAALLGDGCSAVSAVAAATLRDEFDIVSHPEIGPYKLLERLGEGGMGTVYMAQQQFPMQRKVALKLIKPGMDSQEVIARFEAERQALALMDHSNIARIYDAGTTEKGRPYFVMELVRGFPIDQYCDEAQLGLRERLQLFLNVCRAVQHAHLKGVIHRDLKPSNVLVTLHDGVPVVKVIDFGIAKALNRELTEKTLFTGLKELIGTPVYMSPEQAEMSGLDVDTRSDVYSLGVLLYKILSGVTPFDEQELRHAGFDEMRRMIREDDPLRPSRRLTTLSGEMLSTISAQRGMPPAELSVSMRKELDWIVLKSLEKDRRRRYQSAKEFDDDLQRFLHNEPVSACPPTVRYRLQKTFQRKKRLFTAVLVVALILLLSSSVAFWQAVEARRAWRQSQLRERQANDLLEAVQLQAMVTAFRRKDLLEIRDVITASQRQWQSVNRADAVPSTSLTRFLQKASVPTPLRSFAHDAAVTDVSLSDDGSRMVSVDAKGTVRLWKPDDSMPPHVLGSIGANAVAVAVSPDGKTAVSGSWSGEVRFWDLERRKATRQLHPLTTGIETLVWSPDGKYVAAGARYSEIWVFDAAGREMLRLPSDRRHEALLFSADGTELYVPTLEGVDIWQIGTQERVTSIATPSHEDMRAMCWLDADRHYLAFGTMHEDSLRVLNRRTPGHDTAIMLQAEYAQHIAASPDGNWLAGTYADGRLQLIRLTSKTEIVTGHVDLEFKAHDVTTESEERPRAVVRWLPDSRRFVTGGDDRMAHLWDVQKVRPVSVQDPAKNAKYVFFGPGERLVYLFHDKAQPAEYDPQAHTSAVAYPRVPHPYNAVDCLPARHLVAISGDGQILLMSLASRQIIARIDTVLDKPLICISPEGKSIAAVDDSRACVWHTNDGWATHRQVCVLDDVHRSHPVFADQGKTLVLLDAADVLVERRLPEGTVFRKHQVELDSLTFRVSDSDHLLAISDVDSIQVVNRQTGRIVADFESTGTVRALLFLPDARAMLSGHKDGSIRALHVSTGQDLGVLYRPTAPIGEPVVFQFDEVTDTLLVTYRSGSAITPVLIGFRR